MVCHSLHSKTASRKVVIFQWTRHHLPALELEMVVKVPMIMKRRNGDVQPKESLENKGEHKIFLKDKASSYTQCFKNLNLNFSPKNQASDWLTYLVHQLEAFFLWETI